MDLVTFNPELSGYCKVFLNDDPVAIAEAHNDILSSAPPFFANSSSVADAGLKVGSNNTPNTPTQSALNTPYTQWSHLISKNTFLHTAESLTYVEEPGGNLVWTMEYIIAITPGFFEGLVGELGMDFGRSNTPNVQTRVVFATPFNVGLTDKLVAHYTFTFRIPQPNRVINFNYVVNGVDVPATCTVTWVNLTSWTWVGLLKHLFKHTSQKYGAALPANPNTLMVSTLAPLTKTFQTVGNVLTHVNTFDISNGNVAGGIGAIQAYVGTTPLVNFVFNPPIPKDANSELVFKVSCDYTNIATIGAP